jgi:hypothetical protein
MIDIYSWMNLVNDGTHSTNNSVNMMKSSMAMNDILLVHDIKLAHGSKLNVDSRMTNSSMAWL